MIHYGSNVTMDILVTPSVNWPQGTSHNALWTWSNFDYKLQGYVHPWGQVVFSIAYRMRLCDQAISEGIPVATSRLALGTKDMPRLRAVAQSIPLILISECALVICDDRTSPIPSHRANLDQDVMCFDPGIVDTIPCQFKANFQSALLLLSKLCIWNDGDNKRFIRQEYEYCANDSVYVHDCGAP